LNGESKQRKLYTNKTLHNSYKLTIKNEHLNLLKQ